MTQTKFFTPREANQTLPLVRRIVEDILSAGQQMRDRAAELGTGAESDPQVLSWMEQLEELFSEIESLGCSYRDWNFTLGLVDFPAIIEGEEVSLCWKSDEAEVLFYHDGETGFAGRRPIPESYLKE